MKKFLSFFLYSLITEGVFGESVSVILGDSVTLHTGLTEIQKSDVIEWRFGVELLRIARIRKGSEPSLYEEVLDGKFRGRLKPNSQSGDLTITNIKTTDTGDYEITNSINTFKKSFSITVVSVDQMHSVLVGEFITLQTGLTDTKKYDVIRWKFGPQHSTIAEVNTKDGKVSTFDVPDKRFTNRLQLDYWTGSLTITNIGISHSGLYEVDIIKSSSYTIHKAFNVTVSGEVKSLLVSVGQSVLLHTDTEIQKDDSMLWMFEDIVIVSQSSNKEKQLKNINDGPDGIFRDRLNLDPKTGSLTITNIITEHAGDYKLQISSSRRTVNKKFIVNVKDSRLSSGITAVICVVFVLLVALAVAVAAKYYYRHKISALKEPKCDVVSVKVTDDIILESGVTKTIQNHDVILWVFKGTLIAGMTGDAKDYYDGIFRDRLKLNNQTGSLTITNISTQHAGLYKVSMMIGSNASFRSFEVTVDSTASRGNGAETAILLTQQP